LNPGDSEFAHDRGEATGIQVLQVRLIALKAHECVFDEKHRIRTG
jgi:hypothetical protein